MHLKLGTKLLAPRPIFCHYNHSISLVWTSVSSLQCKSLMQGTIVQRSWTRPEQGWSAAWHSAEDKLVAQKQHSCVSYRERAAQSEQGAACIPSPDKSLDLSWDNSYRKNVKYHFCFFFFPLQYKKYKYTSGLGSIHFKGTPWFYEKTETQEIMSNSPKKKQHQWKPCLSKALIITPRATQAILSCEFLGRQVKLLFFPFSVPLKTYQVKLKAENRFYIDAHLKHWFMLSCRIH